MNRILNYLISAWGKAAGVEPDYTKVIVDRQNMYLREVYKCKTYYATVKLSETVERYFTHNFLENLPEAYTAIAIINSHIGWRQLEIKQEAEKNIIKTNK